MLSEINAETIDDCMNLVDEGKHKRAFEICSILANDGVPHAQFIVGNYYFHGVIIENREVIKKDYIQAIKWFDLAAKQNNFYAQYNLGQMYLRGYGVTRHYGKAIYWTELAAKAGYYTAQYNLAILYKNSSNIKHSNIYALAWFIMASNDNTPKGEFGAVAEKAKQQEVVLSKNMTKDEILIAQEISQKCLDSDYKNCESDLLNSIQ